MIGTCPGSALMYKYFKFLLILRERRLVGALEVLLKKLGFDDSGRVLSSSMSSGYVAHEYENTLAMKWHDDESVS